MITPPGGFVVYVIVLAGVIGHKLPDLVLPGSNPGNGRINVKESVGRINEFKQGILVNLSEFRELHHSLHQQAIITPIVRVLAACINDSARPESIVIVVRNEEELVFVEVCGIEIDIEIVAVGPMVVPHSDSDIDSISLEEKFHIADFLYPFVEALVAFSAQLQDKVLELGLRSLEGLHGALVFVSIVLPVVGIHGPIPVKTVKIGLVAVVAALPEIAARILEHSRQPSLHEFVVNRLNHLVHTIIGRFFISLNVNPETAVNVVRSGPYTITAE